MHIIHRQPASSSKASKFFRRRKDSLRVCNIIQNKLISTQNGVKAFTEKKAERERVGDGDKRAPFGTVLSE